MKQHITWEQFKELSGGSQMLYLRWAREKGYCELGSMELSYAKEMMTSDLDVKLTLPTIGQMIEFLVDAGRLPKFSINRDGMIWKGRHTGNKEMSMSVVWLCDNLWGEIKQILEA